MRSRGAGWAHFYLYGTLLFLRGGAGAHIPCPFCAAGSISAPCGLRLGPEWDRSITWARGYWGERLTLTARALLCPTFPPPGMDNDHPSGLSPNTWRSPVQGRVKLTLAVIKSACLPLLPPLTRRRRCSRPPSSPATKTGKNVKCQNFRPIFSAAPRGPARPGARARPVLAIPPAMRLGFD